MKADYLLFQHVQDLNDNIPVHPVMDRRQSDVNSFKGLAGYKHLNDTKVSHQAIHDAESIFWIIVFFMIRANPNGSDSHKFIVKRLEIFDAIVGHEIGNLISPHRSILSFAEDSWASTLPEKLQGFSTTLHNFSLYFSSPWHGIQVPVKHQFHAHNYLQWLLFREIARLKDMEDPIELELVPLPVQSDLEMTQLTSSLKNSVHFLSIQKRLHTSNSREDMPAKHRKQEHPKAEGDVHPYISHTYFHSFLCHVTH